MDREEKRSFKRWLETAKDAELQKIYLQLLRTETTFTDEGAISDIRYMKGRIIEEIDARRELRAALNNPEQ